MSITQHNEHCHVVEVAVGRGQQCVVVPLESLNIMMSLAFKSIGTSKTGIKYSNFSSLEISGIEDF